MKKTDKHFSLNAFCKAVAIPLGIGAAALGMRLGREQDKIASGNAHAHVTPTTKPSTEIDKDAVHKQLLEILNVREGDGDHHLTVYKDTLGFLTVGMGHRVASQDNLAEGDTITHEQMVAFQKTDTQKACDAACAQAKELKVTDTKFVAVLGSVNFQLGTEWHIKKFPHAWAHMKEHNWLAAMIDIQVNGSGTGPSRWEQQTPERAKDLINVMQEQMKREKPPGPEKPALLSPTLDA